MYIFVIMNTEQYISQLLYRFQCVTVPGFGAFLTETQSAQWNEVSNSFHPPKKVISFNPHLKSNDGLLANHIAQSENISYNNALLAIEDLVSTWKMALDSSAKITLKSIGELDLSKEGLIVFKADEHLNYLTTSFGLTSLVAPVIKREVLNQITTEEPIITIDSKEEEVPVVILSNATASTPYLKYAAVLILALSVTGSIGYKLFQDKIASDTLLVETAVQKQVQNKIQEATFFIETPLPSVSSNLTEDKMPYHVVAGAFRLEENAENIFKELNNKGYKAKRLPQNNHGLYPVIYGSFSSYTAAHEAKLNIQKKDNPNAWLLIEEL
jgi:nucleoid DNA-binding protein